jgi:glycosyltransferase involved in cell wall biosynthesis
MDISIVLCTYNNADRLKITLHSLCRIQLSGAVDWELIIVDNNSTDNTKDVIHSFSDRLPIIYLYEPEQGKSNALNTGVHQARGDLIVFADDDVRPNPNWLSAFWVAYRERSEGYFFGGPIESEFEVGSPDEDLLRAAMPSVAGLDYGHEARSLESDECFVGANWACPKKYLEQVGGFGAELGLNPASGKVQVGEETDLMRRLERMSVKGWYVPEASIKHFVPASKCTLDHVVARRIASTENVYMPGSPMPSTALGIPLGLYKIAFSLWIEWISKRLTGEAWKDEYIRWRMWMERIKNYHQRHVH